MMRKSYSRRLTENYFQNCKKSTNIIDVNTKRPNVLQGRGSKRVRDRKREKECEKERRE